MSEYIVTIILPTDMELPTTLANEIEVEFRNILKEVEGLLGDRDPQYTEFIIRFTDDTNPSSLPLNETNQVIISLMITSLNFALWPNGYQWKYQLAHETVHCLNPGFLGNSNVLEEGIATNMSEIHMNRINTVPYNSNYYFALQKFNSLGNCKYSIIQNIRKSNNLNSISKIDFNELKSEIRKYPTLNHIADVDIQSMVDLFV